MEPGCATVTLDGAAGEAVPAVVMRVAHGRVGDVRAPEGWPVERCLEWIALASGGSVEVRPEAGLRAGTGLPVLTAFSEAEQRASRVSELLDACGGLEAVLVADHDRIIEAADLPEAAAGVLRRVDGRRSAAAILVAQPLEFELTARILHRLALDGCVGLASSGPEPATASSVLPSPDEMAGAAVDADIRRWLAASPVPESLLSEEAFGSLFEVEAKAPSMAARVRATVPISSRRPEPLQNGTSPGAAVESASSAAVTVGESDDDAMWAAAGVGGRGGSRGPWVALGLLLLALGLAFAWSRGAPEPDRPAPPVVASSTVARTATVASVPEVVEQVEPAPAEPELPVRRRRRLTRLVKDAEGRTPLEQARLLIEAGDPEAAERILEELRIARAGSAEVWRLSAQAAVDLGRSSVGLGYADRALARGPRSAESWIVKGAALQFLGRREDAIRAYERALVVEPEHPEAEDTRRVLTKLRETGSR